MNKRLNPDKSFDELWAELNLLMEADEVDELDDEHLLEMKAQEAETQRLQELWAQEEDTDPHALATEPEEAIVPVKINGEHEAGIGTDGVQISTSDYIAENTNVVGRTLAQDFGDQPGPAVDEQFGENFLGTSDSESDFFEPEVPDAGGTDVGRAPVGEKVSYWTRVKEVFGDVTRGVRQTLGRRGRGPAYEGPEVDPRFTVFDDDDASELSLTDSDSESISWTEQEETPGGIRPFNETPEGVAGAEASLRASLQDQVWSGGQGGRALSFQEAGRLISRMHEIEMSRMEGEEHGGDINDPIPEADPFASEPLAAEAGADYGGLDGPRPGEFDGVAQVLGGTGPSGTPASSRARRWWS